MKYCNICFANLTEQEKHPDSIFGIDKHLSWCPNRPITTNKDGEIDFDRLFPGINKK
jgi:hypothetical protein